MDGGTGDGRDRRGDGGGDGGLDGDTVLQRIRSARDRAQERQELCFRQSDEAVRGGDPTKALARTTEAAINRAIVQMLDDILQAR